MHQKKLDLNSHPDVRQAASGFQTRLAAMVNALQDFMTTAATAPEDEWPLIQESLSQAFEESSRAMLRTGIEFVGIVQKLIVGSSCEQKRLHLRSFQPPPLPSSGFSSRTQLTTGSGAPIHRLKQFDV